MKTALAYIGYAFAAVFAVALGIALLIPMAHFIGKEWVHFFGTPNWSLPNLPHGGQPAPSAPAADPFAGHPMAPTTTAKLTNWGQVYGKGDLAIFFHRATGTIRQDTVRSDLAVLYDDQMKRTWTQSGDPIMPKP